MRQSFGGSVCRCCAVPSVPLACNVRQLVEGRGGSVSRMVRRISSSADCQQFLGIERSRARQQFIEQHPSE